MCFAVFEEEDQLLWCPDVLSEKKVEDYLRKALSHAADVSTENSTCGGHVRDNEQVYNCTEHNLSSDFIQALYIVPSQASLISLDIYFLTDPTSVSF